jgi:hypothetical protein
VDPNADPRKREGAGREVGLAPNPEEDIVGLSSNGKLRRYIHRSSGRGKVDHLAGVTIQVG